MTVRRGALSLTPTRESEGKIIPKLSFHRYKWFVSQLVQTQVPATRRYTVELPTFGGNRMGQPSRIAMERPRLGGTTLWIDVSPLSGKYAITGGLRDRDQ